MTNVWNIKALYASGGHIITDEKGFALRFKSEAAANDEVSMLNMDRKDPNVHFIVVKEAV